MHVCGIKNRVEKFVLKDSLKTKKTGERRYYSSTKNIRPNNNSAQIYLQTCDIIMVDRYKKF